MGEHRPLIRHQMRETHSTGRRRAFFIVVMNEDFDAVSALAVVVWKAVVTAVVAMVVVAVVVAMVVVAVVVAMDSTASMLLVSMPSEKESSLEELPSLSRFSSTGAKDVSRVLFAEPGNAVLIVASLGESCAGRRPGEVSSSGADS